MIEQSFSGLTMALLRVYRSCPANVQSANTSTEGLNLAGPNSFRVLAGVGQVGDTFSEDCLTLNIWTKPQTGEKAKAVLFWIYGGGNKRLS